MEMIKYSVTSLENQDEVWLVNDIDLQRFFYSHGGTWIIQKCEEYIPGELESAEEKEQRRLLNKERWQPLIPLSRDEKK